MLYRDSSKKDWATSLNLTTGITNEMDVSDDTYATKFLNPVNEDVQNFILTLLGDLAKYNLDGIFKIVQALSFVDTIIHSCYHVWLVAAAISQPFKTQYYK